MSDPIDRQMAISALRYAQHRFVVADEAGGLGTVKWSENVIYLDAAKRVLEDLPSAQPERMRGKWIRRDRQDNKGKLLYGWYQCSECGAFIGSNEANFCSECGADMREVDDERV